MPEQAPENQPRLSIPPKLLEEASELIRKAFGLFSGHFDRLAKDQAAFELRWKETQEKIRRGARKTDGFTV